MLAAIVMIVLLARSVSSCALRPGRNEIPEASKSETRDKGRRRRGEAIVFPVCYETPGNRDASRTARL
jgi:hypothetical protein